MVQGGLLRCIGLAGAIAAVVFATLANPASACELRLVGLGQLNVGQSYNPFQPGGLSQAEQFRVLHLGEPCEFFVTFSPQIGTDGRPAMQGPRAALAYDLYRSARHIESLRALPGAEEREILAGTFGRGQAAETLNYQFFIPPTQVVAPGAYQAAVQVDVYEGNLSDHRLADSRTVRIRARIAAIVDVTLSAGGQAGNLAGARAVLDFGILTTGQTKYFRLDVRGNSEYEITLESEHRNTLRLVGAPSASEVPYTLTLDGNRIDIAPIVVLPFSTPDRRHRFAVTIGDIGNALRGRYEDSLRITITAR